MNTMLKLPFPCTTRQNCLTSSYTTRLSMADLTGTFLSLRHMDNYVNLIKIWTRQSVIRHGETPRRHTMTMMSLIWIIQDDIRNLGFR